MKKIIFFMATLISTAGFAFNLSISPTGFILPLDRAQNREITLTNNSTEHMRVEIAIEQPSDYKKEHSMNESVKIYPKVLSMPGNSTKTIRFSAKLPADTPDGQYKALVVFKEIPDNPTIIAQQQGETKVNMAMYSEVAIPIYGEKGKLHFDGKLQEMKLSKQNGKLFLQADLTSGGNTTVRPEYKVEYLDTKGKKLGETSGSMPRTSREENSSLSTELLNIPEGAVAAKTVLSDSRGKTLGEKKLNF